MRHGALSTLAAEAAQVLTEHHADPGAPLFPTRRGTPLSRDAIEHRLVRYTELAEQALARTRPPNGRTGR